MIKLMVLIKRRDGMSMEEFIDYYESNHAPLAARSLPDLHAYKRYFLTPFAPDAPELPYDVVTEIVFASQEDLDKTLALLGGGPLAEEIQADEAKLFDRDTITFMQVDERETDLSLASG